MVLLSLNCSVSNAQVDQTTGNLINNNSWTGVGAYAPDPNNCCSNPAGSQPLYDTSTNTIKFSYGQATVQQSIAVNQALANAGTGISVSGYSWGYDLRNMNGKGGQGGTDSLTVNTWLTNNYGQNVAGTSTVYNTPFEWQSFSGTQALPSLVAPSVLGNVGISFSGKDSGFWAGLYGPEVRNVSLRLNYGVDPCATNPAYSTTCAGFDKIIDSANLVPNPDAYGVYGSGVDNSFAINTALKSAGSGISIHGFKWGYVANANGPYCGSWDMGFLGCWDFRIPSITTNVNITDNNGGSLYSIERTYTNSYNTTNYSYLFPASRPVNTLGNFNFTATTNDVAYVGQMWSKAIYTPDPCVVDPTSSPTCPGYFKALGIDTSGTTTATTTIVDPVTTTTTTTITDPVATNSIASTTPVITNPTASPTAAIDVAAPQTTTSSNSSSSVTTASSTPTPSATNPQPKIGEVTTAGSQSKAVSSVSTSQILSIVGSEQSRLSKLETSAAQAAVAQAQQAAEQATAEAQAVAATSSGSSSSFSLLAGPGRGSVLSSTIALSTGVGLKGPESMTVASVQYSARQQQSDDKLRDESKSSSQTNSVTNLLSQQPIVNTVTTESKSGSSVNKNAKDNDAAGSVTIAAIAKQPIGYELYMGAMQDAPFYAPKEIYRNQRVVDNARAQRLLSGASDRLHQELVDLQYNNNKGN